jgi:hypothetical protein
LAEVACMALWHALESCGLLWVVEVATKGRRSVEKWTAVKLQVQLSLGGGGVLVRPLAPANAKRWAHAHKRHACSNFGAPALWQWLWVGCGVAQRAASAWRSYGTFGPNSCRKMGYCNLFFFLRL